MPTQAPRRKPLVANSQSRLATFMVFHPGGANRPKIPSDVCLCSCHLDDLETVKAETVMPETVKPVAVLTYLNYAVSLIGIFVVITGIGNLRIDQLRRLFKSNDER